MNETEVISVGLQQCLGNVIHYSYFQQKGEMLLFHRSLTSSCGWGFSAVHTCSMGTCVFTRPLKIIEKCDDKEALTDFIQINQLNGLIKALVKKQEC